MKAGALTATISCSTWRLRVAIAIALGILRVCPSPRLADFFLGIFERHGLRLLSFRIESRRTR